MDRDSPPQTVRGKAYKERRDMSTQEMADLLRCDPALETSTAAAPVEEYVRILREKLTTHAQVLLKSTARAQCQFGHAIDRAVLRALRALQVLLVSNSMEMSLGTGAAATAALSMLPADDKERVTIWDSQTASALQGFLTGKAAKWAAEGCSMGTVPRLTHFPPSLLHSAASAHTESVALQVRSSRGWSCCACTAMISPTVP
jgi:fatty acid-binding protein DegV